MQTDTNGTISRLVGESISTRFLVDVQGVTDQVVAIHPFQLRVKVQELVIAEVRRRRGNMSWNTSTSLHS